MVSGCTAWRRDDSVLHTTIPQRRPVQVWSQGRALEAHGLEVRSAVGVLLLQLKRQLAT
jgi:hypothetical protein